MINIELVPASPRVVMSYNYLFHTRLQSVVSGCVGHLISYVRSGQTDIRNYSFKIFYRYGGFYLLIKSGVDIPAILESMGTSEVSLKHILY